LWVIGCHYGDEVLKGFGMGENLPWDGRQLIAGTGMYGRLPVMPIDRADSASLRRSSPRSAQKRPEDSELTSITTVGLSVPPNAAKPQVRTS